MSPARPKLALLLALLLPAACAQFPALDAAVSESARTAPDPELVDYRQIVGPATEGAISPETQTTLQSRAEALQSQASSLDGPVLSDGARQELDEATARLKNPQPTDAATR